MGRDSVSGVSGSGLTEFSGRRFDSDERCVDDV